MRVNRKRTMKEKMLNGTRGAISLFLAILMVPFTTIAGALLTASRVNSASTIFDEAMSNAADSTLANWDSYLKDRFGLLATSQDKNFELTQSSLNSTFNSYLVKNTGILNNTFFDTETNCKGMYPLANTDVLKYEVLEYSKLTVPTVMTINGLDINGIIKSLENLIPGKNWFGLISNGLNLGSSMCDLGTALDSLEDAVKEKNTAKEQYESKFITFRYSAKMLSNKIGERDSALSEYDENISSERSNVQSYQGQVNSLSSNNYNKVNGLQTTKNYIRSVQEIIKNKSKSTIASSIESIRQFLSRISSQSEIDGIKDMDKMTIGELKDYLYELSDDVDEKIDEYVATQEYNDYKNAVSQLEEATSALDEYKREREAAEARYNEEIQGLKNSLNTAKSDYSSAINDFANKLKNEKSKRSSALSKIEAMESSCNSLVSSAGDLYSSSDLAKLKEEKTAVKQLTDNLEKEYENNGITQEEYDNKSDYYHYVSELVDESTNEKETMKKLYSETEKGVKNAISAAGDLLERFDETYYDNIVEKLNGLKNKVDNFNSDNISSLFSQDNFTSTYYLTDVFMTESEAIEFQKEILKQFKSNSLWGLIKDLFKALKSFISIIEIYNPSLDSIIEESYYSSVKQSWENLENSNETDKEKSEEYKDLFGAYGASDLLSDGNFSLVDSIITIFSNINTISDKVTNVIGVLTSLFTLGETIKEIERCAEAIKEEFSKIIDWAKNLVSMFYEKTLLAGYLSYATSCRTTYSTGNSITGASFNLRNQKTSFQKDIESMENIGDFIQSILKLFTGESAKCFVGAEQEYLINGKNSEISNQVLTFLEIYGVRLICDIFTMISNTEVQLMAASCGPFAFVVYILIGLLDPLIDTLLITSGASISLIKAQPFLVPSGIPSLIDTVTGLLSIKAVSEEKKNNAAKSLEDMAKRGAEKSGQTYTGVSTEEAKSKFNSSVEIESTVKQSTKTVNGVIIDNSLKFSYKRDFLKFNYQNYLFIYMMFCPSNTLVSRFRDIIQYEATEKIIAEENNKAEIVVEKADPTSDSSIDGEGKEAVFNLAYSYTYIRCEGDFSTNEFLPLSGNNINMKQRIIYRGY